MPKGFLPLQDTGLITAVTEAGTEVSFGEMQRLQKLVADKMRADEDVTGVVSVVGVSPLNATPNAGRLVITLKPRSERKAVVAEIIDRLKEDVADIPGMTVYFQPVQDIQISTRPSRAQYQYTLVGTDAAEVTSWSIKLVEMLRRDPAVRDVSSEAQEGGLRALVNVDREKAGRLGISMQVINDTLNDAFGQRQISTIYGQANQYRVILEAAPQYQRDPVGAREDLRAGEHSLAAAAELERAEHPAAVELRAGPIEHAGAAQRLRGADPHHRAARDRASGAVPLGDAELQSCARRGARRGGQHHRVGRARDRHAVIGDRQLFGRHRGVRKVARRTSRG